MTSASTDKVWDKAAVITLLNTNDFAMARAIVRIYERQTADEVRYETTSKSNGVGFNKVDAPFMTSIAKRLPQYGMKLTPKQRDVARKMMKKYWKQLLSIIEEGGGKVSYKDYAVETVTSEIANPCPESKAVGLSELPAPETIAEPVVKKKSHRYEFVENFGNY